MVRSATAVLAVLILSGFVAVQQTATHDVVAGDTLWDLAQRYYQNPFEWRRIWEANRAQVTDPNLIEPGWVLNIPGIEAQVSDVMVETPTQPPAPRTSIRNVRTVFYRDTAAMRGGVVGSERGTFLPVSRDLVYAAPWMLPLDQEFATLGTVDSFAGGASQSPTPRGWNRVHLAFVGESPDVGTQLLAYRVDKTLPNVGRVAVPTGVITISEVGEGEAVGIVTKEYDLMSLGDQLASMPEYAFEPGQVTEAVDQGGEAMIMGFGGNAELQDIGAVAFLDQGSDHGISVGDEFEYVDRQAGREVVEGRLQVVGVTSTTASARILGLADAVFRPGLVVRLARKMR